VAALIVAHPSRRYCPALRGYLEAKGVALAELTRVLRLSGSGGCDAHARGQVGRPATWFSDDIETDEELVMALKQGGYQPVKGAKRR
jgi:hypothetical protein